MPYYHVSPRTNRDSIQQYGLDHTLGQTMWPDVKYPVGNYLFGEWENALNQALYHEDHDGHDTDMWRVDPQASDLNVDPYMPGQGKYATQAIPPSSLALIPNWRDYEEVDSKDLPWRQSNILDPIHDMLDVRVWDNPGDPEPRLKPIHRDWITQKIYEVLDKHGYDGMENWLTLALTGSLTTYQYSEESDCDISLFVNTDAFPDWSRAEMIGIMISEFDTMLLPGTPHPMQCFVVSRRFAKEDLYKPGLRSAYDLETDQWIVPPERSRVHDVEREENEAYTVALESADKMEKLLRYEPDKAVTYWHQVHKRRMRDMNKGKGDYAPSNIVYKMLNNRGLFPKISEVSGEHIAKMASPSTRLLDEKT